MIHNENPDLQLITVREAAKILGIGYQRMARWVREGRVPAFDISFGEGKAQLRIKRRDLVGFVEDNKKFYSSGEADDTPA